MGHREDGQNYAAIYPSSSRSPRDSVDSQTHRSPDGSDLEMQRRHSFRSPIHDPPGAKDKYRAVSPRRTRQRSQFAFLMRLPDLCARPRNVLTLFKYTTALLFLIALIVYLLAEIHIEIMWYSRHWVAKEVTTLHSLGGCFDSQHISSAYDLTAARAPKRTNVHAGVPLRFGMDCYDFAGTIQPDGHPVTPTLFHTYWRVDLAPFTDRQEWMLKSFFATQNVTTAKLILWSNGDISHNSVLQEWRMRYPDAFSLGIVDMVELARGTVLEGSALLKSSDSNAWVDGDLLRLLLLWNYGGVWVDMDSLLTRELSPLLEHEFVTQWDCYDKKYQPFNGALMHFLKHSPYLCEFFHLMATSSPPRPRSTDWGSLLYLKLWRSLVAAGIPPFKILPFCLTDARSCRMDNRLPDPFERDPWTWADGLGLQGEGSTLQVALEKVFSVHLHNQWAKTFPPGGWVERYLLNKYNRILHLSN